MVDKCLKVAKQAGKEFFTDSEIKSHLEDFRRAKNIAQQTGENIRDVFKSLHNKKLDDFNLSEQIKIYRAAKNAAIYHQRTEFMKQFVNFKKGLVRGITSLLTGTEFGKIKGVRFSTENKIRREMDKFETSFAGELEDNELKDFYNNNDNEGDIGNAVANLSRQRKLPATEKATQVAKIWNKYIKKLKNDFLEEGMIISSLDGRIVANFHNPEKLMQMGENWKEELKENVDFIKAQPGWAQKIQKALERDRIPYSVRQEAAYQRWKNFIRPDATNSLLDERRTFRDMSEDQIDKTLRNVFKKISNNGLITQKNFSYVNKYGEKRFLHFKDGEATALYAKKYGFGSMRDSMTHEMRSMIRDLQVVKDWGDKPNEMLDQVWNWGKSQKGTEIEEGTLAQRDKMHVLLDMIRGAEQGRGGALTTISKNIRQFFAVTELGKVLFAQQLDEGPITNETAKYSSGYLDATRKNLALFTEIRDEEDRKFAAQKLNIMTEQLAGSHMEANPLDNSNAVRIINKLNLNEWWHSKQRQGIGGLISNFLADAADDSFDRMSEENQKTLLQYDIGKDEWDAIIHSKREVFKGKNFLTPDGIQYIDDKHIKDLLRKRGFKRIPKARIAKTKDELEQKMGVYILDRIDHAVLRSSHNDRRMLMLGTKKGTIARTIVEQATQFKSYPTAFMTKTMASKIYGNGAQSISEAILNGSWDYAGLAQLGVYLTVLGYVKIAADAISENKTPPPMSKKTVADAFIEGGFGTMYLETVFNDFSQRDIGTALLGPAGGRGVQMANLIKGIFTDKKTPTGAAVRLLKDSTPNPFYIKPILDYLFWHPLQNWANPNYTQRQLRYLKENDQKLIIPAMGVTN